MARILIAEDNEMLRHLLREVLEREGHHITEAQDGQEALRLWDPHQFDLVITDMQMPRAGGPEVIRTIRATTPDAKIIAMSADPMILSALHRATLTTPQYSFTKPVSLITLQAAIDSLELTAA
jgi:CheY-like chemotaxis protein